jgi:hypothetical protein
MTLKLILKFMRQFFLSVILILSGLALFAQSEAVSPTYSFQIKKKIEPPILDFVPGSVMFKDADGNNAINANEACAIEFKLRNTGTGDGLNLRAKLTATGTATGISFAENGSIENLPKGNTKSYSVNLNAGMNTLNGEAEFKLEIEEPNGFNSEAVALVISTRKFAAPHVEVVDHIIFSTDGSSSLALRKPFTLQLLVQNTGQGPAQSVSYSLNHPENAYITGGDESGNLGTLAAGETRSLEFEMILNAKFVGTSLNMDLDLSESFNKYSQDWKGAFALNQALAQERLKVESNPENVQTFEVASLRSDVDKDIPAGLAPNKKKYALIIGNEDYTKYQPGLQSEVNVDYAANDAKVFAEYAEKTLGVPKENITLLIDATKGQMSQALAKQERLLEVEKGQAEVIFYYSGHGLPEESTNTPYLIPVDVSGMQPTNGIALMEVYQRLSKFPSKKAIVILDACFSGGARSKELVAMKSVRVSANVSSVPANLVVLASSSGTEASAVYKDKQHGYFTYFLLKALKESKGQIGLREMMDAAEQNVAREAARIGKVQTPNMLFGPDVESIQNSLKW